MNKNYRNFRIIAISLFTGLIISMALAYKTYDAHLMKNPHKISKDKNLTKGK